VPFPITRTVKSVVGLGRVLTARYIKRYFIKYQFELRRSFIWRCRSIAHLTPFPTLIFSHRNASGIC